MKQGSKKRAVNQYQEAFSKLRQNILKGTLAPSQRLLELNIAKQLNMSRTPVREALRELEIKRYAKRISKRKLIVADHNQPKDVRNILEVRQALEPLAISLACKRSIDAQIEQVKKSYIRCEEAINNRDPKQFSVLNKAFHMDLFTGCDNERLLSFIDVLLDQTFDIRVCSMYSKEDWQITSNQHKKLVDALEARNAKLAAKIQANHTKRFLRLALEHI